MTDPSRYVEEGWARMLEWSRSAKWPQHQWLAPLIEEMLRYPRLRVLCAHTSHATLVLSETTHFPYASHHLPCAEPREEGWFRVYRFKPRMRGVWLWRRTEYYETEVVGEGDAETTAKLMDELVPSDCGPAILGTADDWERLRRGSKTT